MPNSKDVGDETEAAAINRLVQSGFSVAVPFGDNDSYDLLLDDGGEIHRLQCKTAWKEKPNTIRFNTHSQTTRDGEYFERTYGGLVDAFFVRFPARETFYWIDVVDATEPKMELRFESEIDHPAINWADEYRFDGEPPANDRRSGGSIDGRARGRFVQVTRDRRRLPLAAGLLVPVWSTGVR